MIRAIEVFSRASIYIGGQIRGFSEKESQWQAIKSKLRSMASQSFGYALGEGF
jgi:hypothetical protein